MTGVTTPRVTTPRTVPSLCATNADLLPGAMAVIDDRGARVTYGALHSDIQACARGLGALGARGGAPIALLAPNDARWVVASVACHTLGAPVAAFNTWVRAHDLDFLLGHAAVETLLVAGRVGERDLLEPLLELVPELRDGPPGAWRSARYPTLRRVVVIGQTAPAGAHLWADVLQHGQQGDELRAPAVPEDTAFILYTSGSTAAPKAVPLRHGDMIDNATSIGDRMGLGPDDKVWLGSPLFWSFGVANAMMAAFTHGSTLVVQEKFDAAQAARQISAEGCTAAYLLPTLAHALLRVPDVRQAFATVRTGLTIGRPDEVSRIVTGLGVGGICNVYGSTEVYGNCSVTPHDMPLERRLRCQGPPLDGVEIRITDLDTGAPLPAGEEGAIEVRGHVMPGYWKDPELTAKVLTADGWFRTGDVGRLGADGAVEYVTRANDMIKTSGINVSPAEIEAFLAEDDRVAESVVLGVPDPVRGEAVVAVVRVAPGATLVAADVEDLCRRHLASYKVPREVHIVTEMPQTDTGKLSRRLLLDLVLAADAGERS